MATVPAAVLQDYARPLILNSITFWQDRLDNRLRGNRGTFHHRARSAAFEERIAFHARTLDLSPEKARIRRKEAIARRFTSRISSDEVYRAEENRRSGHPRSPRSPRSPPSYSAAARFLPRDNDLSRYSLSLGRKGARAADQSRFGQLSRPIVGVSSIRM